MRSRDPISTRFRHCRVVASTAQRPRTNLCHGAAMTNTQQRLTALSDRAERAGFPVEVMRGLWRQLHGLTPAGRDQLLTRWEQTAEQWPAEPVDAEARDALAGATYVV